MYANIIIDISHEKLDKTFQYAIPDHMLFSLSVGMQVRIPFGVSNRMITGYVIEITDVCEYDVTKMKSIDSIVEGNIPIEGKLISLASWIRHNYGSTMNQALKTVLPVKETMKQKEKKILKRTASIEECKAYLKIFEKKNSKARIRLMNALIEEEICDYSLITTKLNISSSTIKYFEENHIIEILSQEYYRNPVKAHVSHSERHTLNTNQEYIVTDIIKRYEEGKRDTCLIHGVTGSGKTEVYMEIIEYVLNQGRQVIMLIPEISLTYQTVMRFYRRFGDKVSIMNSKLSKGERYDQFERARKGDISIMIGPRSALFTPFENLGLIVMDEEHEGAYKSENAPRYHARETAIHIAQENDAFVILGSATPSVASYYKAQKGEYRLYELNNRAVATKLPDVSVVDLREELRKGNKSMFSVKLKELMTDRLAKKQQIMLFINRRGYYGFISCRACGHVMKCPHCDISLTSHKNGRLVCHYCGYTQNPVTVCPKCGSKYISSIRGGTQMVEEAIVKMYPEARVLRMDTDTTSTKDGYEKVLSAFANEEADILVGTQMIVKGHDFPKVTLVGVLAADISLHASDYRAAERTFQLLTQAAGRAGRGEMAGEVVIQTYDPGNYAIDCARRQDYRDFYNQEIEYRRLLKYPPIENMLLVKLSSKNERQLEAAAAKLVIKKEGAAVFGPAKASLYMANDIYNMVLYIKSEEYGILTEVKDDIEHFVWDNPDFKYVSVQFDFNPMN